MRADAIASSLRDASHRARERIRAAPPWAIVAIGWVVLAIYAYPGQVTWDSLEALAEVRAGVYTDGAPPVFKALWSVTEQFAAGPLGMFVAQSLAFALGSYEILHRTLAARAAAWTTCGLLVFPPVLLPLAVIWEHSMMAALLVLGVAGLLASRRRFVVVGLGVLFIASGVHYAACIATLPLVVLLFRWSADAAPLRRYALAVGTWGALTIAAFGVNALLTDVTMYRRLSTVAVHDIAGIMRFARPLPDDATLRPILADTGIRADHELAATLSKRYSPRDSITLIAADKGAWQLPLYGRTPAPSTQRAAISDAWTELVTRYPREYLRHRLAVTLQILKQHVHAVVPRTPAHYEVALAAGVPTTSSATQAALTDAMTVLATYTPLFMPALYLLAALITLVFARRHRDVVALLASGLAWELAMCFVAPSAEHRHSAWLIVATTLAIVVRVARRPRA